MPRPIPPPPARQTFEADATHAYAPADSDERRMWELAHARRARAAAKHVSIARDLMGAPRENHVEDTIWDFKR